MSGSKQVVEPRDQDYTKGSQPTVKKLDVPEFATDTPPPRAIGTILSASCTTMPCWYHACRSIGAYASTSYPTTLQPCPRATAYSQMSLVPPKTVSFIGDCMHMCLYAAPKHEADSFPSHIRQGSGTRRNLSKAISHIAASSGMFELKYPEGKFVTPGLLRVRDPDVCPYLCASTSYTTL